MNKLKLYLAASIAALALYSCGAEGAAMLTPIGSGYTSPDDKTNTDITITFKNGWEDIAQNFTEKDDDDPYTDYPFFKALTPDKTNAVVDSAELNSYKEKLAVYNEIKAEWDTYQKDVEKAENAGEDPPPPPTEPLPAEPVYPIAAIPYFPGNEYLSGGNVKTFGSAPEWDFHTLIGWAIEGGEEVSLNTPHIRRYNSNGSVG
jgi:hypothetical protein